MTTQIVQANAHAAHDPDQLLELYRRMVLIRRFEEEVERQYKRARIGGYCHVASGQEAATVGAVAAMDERDVLISSYRTHGLALARGCDPGEVMAELFGREDGSARGRGGSMHLLDVDRRYLGGWGIVGGQLPIAVGVALALVHRKQPHAVLCELGDGAVNIGAWHEALNLAALWRLPVVFLVMNNRYGMGTSVERASAEPELHRRAAAFRMHGESVDGQDLEAVLEVSEELLERARTLRKPAVLEAVTYRYRGHSVADPGTDYRSQVEREDWHARDPLVLFADVLRERGPLDDLTLHRIETEMAQLVEQAVVTADASSHPPVETLADHVYGDRDTGDQFARMSPGSPFGEVELVLRGLTR
jgi:pyruvate dehydrogenase E1 component alpha subunit